MEKINTAFKYIYGPVPSWRLGSSLGIDLLSQKDKICNFDCIYCQLGATKQYTTKRKIYISVKKITDELKKLPDVRIDYITFSGRGEPTLAKNLGSAIKAVKKLRKKKTAVLTNACLMDRKDVRKDLAMADFVAAKLDAFSQGSLSRISRPHDRAKFDRILAGIKQFRKEHAKKLALQVMFTAANKGSAARIARLVNDIRPDEVQINTPLRPCRIKPLTRNEIRKIKKYFTSTCNGVHIVSVYDKMALKHVKPISDKDTLKRRGKL